MKKTQWRFPSMDRLAKIEKFKLGRDGEQARASRRQQANRYGLDPEHFDRRLLRDDLLGACDCPACEAARAILAA